MTFWVAGYICRLQDQDAVIYEAEDVGKGFEICVTGAREIWHLTHRGHIQKVRFFNMPKKRYVEASNDEALKARIYPFEQCLQSGAFEYSSGTFIETFCTQHISIVIDQSRFDSLVKNCEIVKECHYENSWRILNPDLELFTLDKSRS